MLELKSISKTFKKINISSENIKVLDDISININEGEIVSILGKSGSGKSTLLNIIAGFEDSNKGSIKYNEKIIFDNNINLEAQDRNVGFVFQNYALFPHLNVQKNISFGISEKSKDEQSSIVNNLLELINMQDMKDKFPHQLSGGQQQRVAIARVLARKSELILFDEAFSSVDTSLKLKLIKEIKQIIKSQNKTAIFVTHCPREAVLLSDKIAYLEDGKIIQFDTAENLYKKPKSNNIKEIFSKDNFLFKDIDELISKNII